VVIFRSQQWPASKKGWKTLVMSDSWLWYPWLWAYCSCEFRRRPVPYRFRGLEIQFVFFFCQKLCWIVGHEGNFELVCYLFGIWWPVVIADEDVDCVSVSTRSLLLSRSWQCFIMFLSIVGRFQISSLTVVIS